MAVGLNLALAQSYTAGSCENILEPYVEDSEGNAVFNDIVLVEECPSLYYKECLHYKFAPGVGCTFDTFSDTSIGYESAGIEAWYWTLYE